MNLTVISLLKNFDESCLKSYNSLYSQSSKNFEHIVIYKEVNEKHLNFLKQKFYLTKFVNEIPNDHKNKFFALNQAIEISSGKYIMVLHSDDFISNQNLISEINNSTNTGVDFITTGVEIINNQQRIIRKWMFSKNIDYFGYSDIPPHTGFIYNKILHNLLGPYSLNFPIAADFDFMLKYFSKYKNKLTFKIIENFSIKMSFGGDSTKLQNLLKVFFEDRLIFKLQHKNFPTLRAIYKKVRKIRQFQ